LFSSIILLSLCEEEREREKAVRLYNKMNLNTDSSFSLAPTTINDHLFAVIPFKMQNIKDAAHAVSEKIHGEITRLDDAID
jgi:hypothetical protein